MQKVMYCVRAHSRLANCYFKPRDHDVIAVMCCKFVISANLWSFRRQCLDQIKHHKRCSRPIQRTLQIEKKRLSAKVVSSTTSWRRTANTARGGQIFNLHTCTHSHKGTRRPRSVWEPCLCIKESCVCVSSASENVAFLWARFVCIFCAMSDFITVKARGENKLMKFRERRTKRLAYMQRGAKMHYCLRQWADNGV
jgi:histidinol phosphatase-like enzyme